MSEKWLAKESYKSLTLYANSMFRSPVLLNGGAILALLTFLGHFLKSNKAVAVDLSWPIGCFLLGLILGVMGNVFGYLTQLCVFNMRMEDDVDFQKIGPGISPAFGFSITLGLILGGIILFGIGAFLSLVELQSISPLCQDTCRANFITSG